MRICKEIEMIKMKFKRILFIHKELELLVFEYENGLYGLSSNDRENQELVISPYLFSLVRTDGFKRIDKIDTSEIKRINENTINEKKGYDEYYDTMAKDLKNNQELLKYNKSFIRKYTNTTVGLKRKRNKDILRESAIYIETNRGRDIMYINLWIRKK